MSNEDDGDEDPFERLDDGTGDREGDPFEHFEDTDNHPEAGTDVAGSDETSDEATTPESFDLDRSGEPEVTDTREESIGPGRDDAGSEDRDTESGHQAADAYGIGDPFGDDPPRDGDPFESGTSVFDAMDVEELDPDEVWEDIDSAESRGPVGKTTGPAHADVPKSHYCEQCEYFSEPPEVGCTHDGTEIVEFVDMETVRVVDCPIVAERQELEDEPGAEKD